MYARLLLGSFGGLYGDHGLAAVIRNTLGRCDCIGEWRAVHTAPRIGYWVNGGHTLQPVEVRYQPCDFGPLI